MTGMMGLVLGAIAFVGTHFLLSHPLRASMVGALGEKMFSLTYVVVSFATLYLMVHFYHRAFADSPAVLWDAGSVGWIAGTVLMWIGSILFVGSLKSNPAFPTGGKPVTRIGAASGVFAITRHPMMWGFAIWALAHAIVAPSARVLILTGAVAFLALAGAHGQDLRKSELDPREWNVWRKRTSYWPKLSAAPELARHWLTALLAWLAITWLHMPVGHIPAGLWRLFQ